MTPPDNSHLFQSTWNNKETKVIRVPAALADTVLSVARHLDKGEPLLLVSNDDLDAITSFLNNLSGTTQLVSPPHAKAHSSTPPPHPHAIP